jgi:hypothetical protein
MDIEEKTARAIKSAHADAASTEENLRRGFRKGFKGLQVLRALD